MRGPTLDEGPLEALTRMGASAAQLADLRDWLREQQREFALWPDNARAVRVLCAMGTQWRVSMSGVVGLDYGVLKWVFRQCAIGKKHEADTFAGLQILEREVLTLMTEKT